MIYIYIFTFQADELPAEQIAGKFTNLNKSIAMIFLIQRQNK